MQSKATESAIKGVGNITINNASTDSEDLEDTPQKRTKIQSKQRNAWSLQQYISV